jgi:hypothetical protein
MKARTLLVAVGVIAIPFAVFHAELSKPGQRVPSLEIQVAARKMCTDLFDNLRAGKTAEIADWIIAQLGYSYSEADKITKRNDFKSKLDLMMAGPPASPYGKLDGYDVLDEGYLPGSARYFRYVYISYHQKAPLVWEFRFYFGPNNQVVLTYITWSEKNPFEYLSTSDMRLPAWVKQ